MNKNLNKVHKYCIDITNIVNSLFVPLNIFVALVDVVVWTRSNEIDFTNYGNTTLNNFLNYRRDKLVKNYPNDYAHLLTITEFSGYVVGEAKIGGICTQNSSGSISTYKSDIMSTASTIAHEMGHSFGMIHDTNDCKCNDERCIMSDSALSTLKLWSNCSYRDLTRSIRRVINLCLKNIPTKLFKSSTCGNGFVEPGEDCDVGISNNPRTSCCNSKLCKFRSGALCATGKCCDLSTCQPRKAGFECRSSAGVCDIPEYCDGNSEFCPDDQFKQAQLCGEGKALCYNGLCKSRDDQCKLLWGPYGKSSEPCYILNSNGIGYCGYNQQTNVFEKCSKNDINCGLLHCVLSNNQTEHLQFGTDSNVRFTSGTYAPNGGSHVRCKSISIDMGFQTTDQGLAPDGSMCGDERMCVNQKCIPIKSIRSGIVKEFDKDSNKYRASDGNSRINEGVTPPNGVTHEPRNTVKPTSGISSNSTTRIIVESMPKSDVESTTGNTVKPAADSNKEKNNNTILYISVSSVLIVVLLIVMLLWRKYRIETTPEELANKGAVQNINSIRLNLGLHKSQITDIKLISSTNSCVSSYCEKKLKNISIE